MHDERENFHTIPESNEVLFEALPPEMRKALRPELLGKHSLEQRLLILMGADFERRLAERRNGKEKT